MLPHQQENLKMDDSINNQIDDESGEQAMPEIPGPNSNQLGIEKY